jgi:flagellar protein FliS
MSVMARNRYIKDSIRTAPPARLVTMLYDGLVNDIAEAQAALEQRDLWTVNHRLLRAQAIVVELQVSLKPELWAGAAELNRIYSYVRMLLFDANMTKDATKMADARRLVEPLRLAWHSAAEQVLSGELQGAGTASR